MYFNRNAARDQQTVTFGILASKRFRAEGCTAMVKRKSTNNIGTVLGINHAKHLSEFSKSMTWQSIANKYQLLKQKTFFKETILCTNLMSTVLAKKLMVA